MAYEVATVGLSPLCEQSVKTALDGLAEAVNARYCVVPPDKAELLFLDGRSLEGLGLLSAYHDDQRKSFIIIGNVRPELPNRMHHFELPIDERKLGKLLVDLYMCQMNELSRPNEEKSEGDASITSSRVTCQA